MEHIKNLLNQVGIIDNKNTEILDASGGRFNMFSVCGVNHYENTHSAIITELLNPKGAHGLKYLFLKSFIETLGIHFTVDNFNCEKARIYKEYFTPEGRIDIFIKDEDDNVIIIENKIYAVDQEKQLYRYNCYAQKSTKNHQILYLTLQGDDASEQSSQGIIYTPISYSTEIIHWLEACVAIASRFPIVRETIIQYINHLKQLTGQDMDTKNKEEIVQLLSQVGNLKAAQAIAQNYNATFNYLAEKHFNPLMRDYAKENGLEYHYELSEEKYIRFYLTHTQWKKKYQLAYTGGDSSKPYYGIKLLEEDSNAVKIIHDNLKKQGITSPKKIGVWVDQSSIDNLTIDIWESNIINSTSFMEDCKNKIDLLLKAMEGIDFK